MMLKPTQLMLLAAVALFGGSAAIWLTGDKHWSPPEARLPDVSLYQLPDSPGKRFALAPNPELADRPLFSESRRPPQVVAVAQAPEEEQDPLRGLKILGLFGAGKDGGGIFELEGKVLRVRVGERLGPWVLQSINGSTAQLTRTGGRRTSLSLKHLPQPNVPALVPGAPPAPPAAASQRAEPSQPASPESAARPAAQPTAEPEQAPPAAPQRRRSLWEKAPPDSDTQRSDKPASGPQSSRGALPAPVAVLLLNQVI